MIDNWLEINRRNRITTLYTFRSANPNCQCTTSLELKKRAQHVFPRLPTMYIQNACTQHMRATFCLVILIFDLFKSRTDRPHAKRLARIVKVCLSALALHRWHLLLWLHTPDLTDHPQVHNRFQYHTCTRQRGSSPSWKLPKSFMDVFFPKVNFCESRKLYFLSPESMPSCAYSKPWGGSLCFFTIVVSALVVAISVSFLLAWTPIVSSLWKGFSFQTKIR